MNHEKHPTRSRAKPRPAGEEDAGAKLSLGAWQDVEPLTLSETKLVLDAIMAKRRDSRKDPNETEVLSLTRDYLDNFARFKGKDNVEAVERLLTSHKELAKYERAQLGSLCCDNADEAKTLIPSLADKISDEALDEICAEIGKLMDGN